VPAVHVRISQHRHPAVAHGFYVKVRTDSRADGCHDGGDLPVLEQCVQVALLHVRNLAAQRENSVIAGVPRHLAGASCRIPLDEVERRMLEGHERAAVAPLDVGQFAQDELARVHGRLLDDQLARLGGCLPAARRGKRLVDDRAAHAHVAVLVQVGEQFAVGGRKDGAVHLGAVQALFGLAQELGRGAHRDADDRRQAKK